MMDVKLCGQVGDPEVVRENFNKIVAALKVAGGTSGALKFKGSWNADTNNITSSDVTINNTSMPTAASGNEGWYFIIDTEGTTEEDGISDWKVNDWIVSTGSVWIKVNNNGSSGGGPWGTIGGSLPDQTDLQGALDLLQAQINAITAIGNKLFNYYNFI